MRVFSTRCACRSACPAALKHSRVCGCSERGSEFLFRGKHPFPSDTAFQSTYAPSPPLMSTFIARALLRTVCAWLLLKILQLLPCWCSARGFSGCHTSFTVCDRVTHSNTHTRATTRVWVGVHRHQSCASLPPACYLQVADPWCRCQRASDRRGQGAT
jgi:hypothetical protein